MSSGNYKMFNAASEVLLFKENVPEELYEKIEKDEECVKIMSDSLKTVVTHCGIPKIFNREGTIDKTKINDFFGVSLSLEVYKNCKGKESSNRWIDVLLIGLGRYLQTGSEESVKNKDYWMTKLESFKKACGLVWISNERHSRMKYKQETVERMVGILEEVAKKHGIPDVSERTVFSLDSIEPLKTEFLVKMMDGMLEGSSRTDILENMIEMMQNRLKQPIDDDEQEYVELIKRSTEEVSQLLNKEDPFVTFRDEKMRYSKFLRMDRKKCSVYKLPNGEYIAFDAEELQNGLDALGIPLDIEKETVSLEEHFGDGPIDGFIEKDVENFKKKCSIIAGTGKAVGEVIEKGRAHRNPIASRVVEKKEERRREAEAMKEEGKGVHVKIIDEQEV